jgi:hypothetical protein
MRSAGKLAPLCLVALALNGCAATGGIGLAGGALTGALAGIAPTITVEQILEQYALYHNLKVQLEMIDAMGIVTTTTQTPVIVTGTPMTPMAPTGPVASPAPPVMAPTSPVVSKPPAPIPAPRPVPTAP